MIPRRQQGGGLVRLSCRSSGVNQPSNPVVDVGSVRPEDDARKVGDGARAVLQQFTQRDYIPIRMEQIP
jgi:hypothetical protein